MEVNFTGAGILTVPGPTRYLSGPALAVLMGKRLSQKLSEAELSLGRDPFWNYTSWLQSSISQLQWKGPNTAGTKQELLTVFRLICVWALA